MACIHDADAGGLFHISGDHLCSSYGEAEIVDRFACIGASVYLVDIANDRIFSATILEVLL